MAQVAPYIANFVPEQAVLGSVLLRPTVMGEVAGVLTADDFFRDDHRLIFRAMEELHIAGKPIDLLTVIDALKKRGDLEAAGGPLFLADLSEHVGTAANAGHYARLVYDKATLRQIQELGRELASKAEETGITPAELQNLLESRTHYFASRNSDRSMSLDRAILPAADFEALEIPERASLLNPFLKESSIGMVTADRGTGKTMLALSLCDTIARGTDLGPWKGGAPANCLFVDGEMVAQDIKERLSYFPGDRPAKLFVLSDHLASMKGFVGASLLNPAWCSKIKEYCRGDDVRFVVFDNLAALAGGCDENAAQEWAPIAKYFRELRFAGIAVLLLHHTNKSGTQRGTHSREDALDYSIILERPRNYHPEDGASFTLRFTKARVRQSEAHLTAPVNFKLEQDPAGGYTWAWSWVKKAKKEEIRKMLEQGDMTHQEIADAVGVGRTYVTNLKAKIDKAAKLH